ncbi:MAG: ATP-binding protein [Bacteroidia bacterium]
MSKSETQMEQGKSVAEYKTLFESVPGLYLVLLPNLTIYAVSDAYAEATMTKREEIIGKHLFEVFPDNPEDDTADGVSNLRASLNFVLKNKITHTMAVQKYDIRRHDGTFEERYWSPLNKPVLNEKNEVIYIIHRAKDVTEFEKLQKEQLTKDKLADDARMRVLEMEREIIKRSQEIQKLNEDLEKKVAEGMESLVSVNKDVSDYWFALNESSIVAVTDQKGIIQHVNDNFCKISKYGRNELIGKDHRIINSGYHPKEFIRELWTTIANGKIWKGELKNKAKDGTFYWVDTSIVPFLNQEGKPYKYLAIRADITQRKDAEEELKKSKEQLEERVMERTLELTSALEREKDLSEMKTRFVSMASHEFRTPLSAILSSASLIEQYQLTEQKEKRQKHVDRIKSSVTNLTGILNDFLSLDKIEQGKVEIEKETFNLKDFSEDVAEDITGYLKAGQKINYTHGGEEIISQDKKILRNVLLNLLSNACKYSPENKEIDFGTEVGKNRVIIRVKDSGIGIPESEQKNLFSKFYRAKNATNIQGTGLGLNIVRRYVELMEGGISFTSKLNEGTTFTVEFPQNSNS